MSAKTLRNKIKAHLENIDDEDALTVLEYTTGRFAGEAESEEEEEETEEEGDGEESEEEEETEEEEDTDENEEEEEDDEPVTKKKAKSAAKPAPKSKKAKAEPEEEEEEEEDDLPKTVKGLNEYIETNFGITDTSEVAGMEDAEDRAEKVEALKTYIRAVEGAPVKKLVRMQKFAEKNEVDFSFGRGKSSDEKKTKRLAAAILAAGHELP